VFGWLADIYVVWIDICLLWYVFILNKNTNTTCKVLAPCFICTKSLFISAFSHKFVHIPVSEHFSFAKIINPPNRCGISRSWFKQYDHYTCAPCAGGNKRPLKMCSFVT
jgi:hypothetical protein